MLKDGVARDARNRIGGICVGGQRGRTAGIAYLLVIDFDHRFVAEDGERDGRVLSAKHEPVRWDLMEK